MGDLSSEILADASNDVSKLNTSNTVEEDKPVISVREGKQKRKEQFEIDKKAIRQLASELGLGELSELPSSPCLASRVQTGIPVTSNLLNKIDKKKISLEIMSSREKVLSSLSFISTIFPSKIERECTVYLAFA